jgi:hypothetical protein
MKTLKLSTETKSWMRRLSAAAKSMLFALPFLVGQNLAFAEETTTEKVQTGVEGAWKDTQQEYRNLQNEMCDPKID